MANSNAPTGSKIAWHLMDSYIGLRAFTVPTTDATALFVNDEVKLTGTAAVGDDDIIHPIVTQAAATDIGCGIVVAFLPSSLYPNQIYRSASTLRVALVCIDPRIIVEIQCLGTLAVTDIGLNADLDVTTVAGSTVTGLSGAQLDLSTKNTTSKQYRIIDIVQRPDNEYGAYAKVHCMINKHRYLTDVGV